MLGLVEARASTQNVQSVRAFSVAYAGMQRALRAIERSGPEIVLGAFDGRVLNDPNSPGTGGILSGTDTQIDNIWFNWVDTAAGADWHLNGQAHYSDQTLTATVDDRNLGFRAFLLDDHGENDGDPLADSNGVIVIRVYGWVGSDGANRAEAVVEQSYKIPDLSNLPAAFIGCFPDPDVDIKYEQEFGPGFPYVTFRIDGFTANPIAYNADPFRTNGVSQHLSSVRQPLAVRAQP